MSLVRQQAFQDVTRRGRTAQIEEMTMEFTQDERRAEEPAPTSTIPPHCIARSPMVLVTRVAERQQSAGINERAHASS